MLWGYIAIYFEASFRSARAIESKGCEACNTILSHGSFLISGRTLQDFTLTYTFIVPSFKAYRNIITVLEDLGLQLKVSEVGKIRAKKRDINRKTRKDFMACVKCRIL